MKGNLFERAAFISRVVRPVKSLAGWKKTHRPPERPDVTAQDYVAGISASELKEELDAVFNALKSEFGLKRREVEASEPGDGTGTILTPHFTYSIDIAFNPADMSEVIWTKSVEGIKSPSQIESDAFARVFDNVFSNLELALPTSIEIPDFIDEVEAAEVPGLRVDYDRDATYCVLVFEGAADAVRLTSDTLSIVFKRPAPVSALIRSLEAVSAVVQERGISLMPLAND